MINLFGVYECSADAKGRVMIPAAMKIQLKKIFKQGFVIKRSIFNKSLELYPMSSWEGMSKEVNGLNKFVKKNVTFISMFNYGVKQVELDGNMRFLIPKELQVAAGIKKDVVLASAVDRVEIWDKKTYEKFIKENSAAFEKLAEEVMGGAGTSKPNDK